MFNCTCNETGWLLRLCTRARTSPARRACSCVGQCRWSLPSGHCKAPNRIVCDHTWHVHKIFAIRYLNEYSTCNFLTNDYRISDIFVSALIIMYTYCVCLHVMRHVLAVLYFLQVLLSAAHRIPALKLLMHFLDIGPRAVLMSLQVGILPYVSKLLHSPAKELRVMLVFVWARIVAVDPVSEQRSTAF